MPNLITASVSTKQIKRRVKIRKGARNPDTVADLQTGKSQMVDGGRKTKNRPETKASTIKKPVDSPRHSPGRFPDKTMTSGQTAAAPRLQRRVEGDFVNIRYDEQITYRIQRPKAPIPSISSSTAASSVTCTYPGSNMARGPDPYESPFNAMYVLFGGEKSTSKIKRVATGKSAIKGRAHGAGHAEIAKSLTGNIYGDAVLYAKPAQGISPSLEEGKVELKRKASPKEVNTLQPNFVVTPQKIVGSRPINANLAEGARQRTQSEGSLVKLHPPRTQSLKRVSIGPTYHYPETPERSPSANTHTRDAVENEIGIVISLPKVTMPEEDWGEAQCVGKKDAWTETSDPQITETNNPSGHREGLPRGAWVRYTYDKSIPRSGTTDTTNADSSRHRLDQISESSTRGQEVQTEEQTTGSQATSTEKIAVVQLTGRKLPLGDTGTTPATHHLIADAFTVNQLSSSQARGLVKQDNIHSKNTAQTLTRLPENEQPQAQVDAQVVEMTGIPSGGSESFVDHRERVISPDPLLYLRKRQPYLDKNLTTEQKLAILEGEKRTREPRLNLKELQRRVCSGQYRQLQRARTDGGSRIITPHVLGKAADGSVSPAIARKEEVATVTAPGPPNSSITHTDKIINWTKGYLRANCHPEIPEVTVSESIRQSINNNEDTEMEETQKSESHAQDRSESGGDSGSESLSTRSSQGQTTVPKAKLQSKVIRDMVNTNYHLIRENSTQAWYEMATRRGSGKTLVPDDNEDMLVVSGAKLHCRQKPRNRPLVIVPNRKSTNLPVGQPKRPRCPSPDSNCTDPWDDGSNTHPPESPIAGPEDHSPSPGNHSPRPENPSPRQENRSPHPGDRSPHLEDRSPSSENVSSSCSDEDQCNCHASKVYPTGRFMRYNNEHNPEDADLSQSLRKKSDKELFALLAKALKTNPTGGKHCLLECSEKANQNYQCSGCHIRPDDNANRRMNERPTRTPGIVPHSTQSAEPPLPKPNRGRKGVNQVASRTTSKRYRSTGSNDVVGPRPAQEQPWFSNKKANAGYSYDFYQRVERTLKAPINARLAANRPPRFSGYINRSTFI